MTTNTPLKTAGKELDLSNYLTTLSTTNEAENQRFKAIEDYNELGFTISSLIGVCQVALRSFAENDHMNASEKENFLGASASEIAKVLEVAKSLIPTPELELLTILKENHL